MKLNDLHDMTCNNILLEKGKGISAYGSTKGKVKSKEDIGKPIETQTAFSKALAAAGANQKEIAKRVGVHPSTISRYKHPPHKGAGAKKKSKARVPSYDTLAKLVDVVGRQPGDMFPELEI